MRLANGIVIDKEATFGALKFSALRREVHLQNEDGSVSEEIKERTYDLKSRGQGRMIQVSIPASVPLKEFDYNAEVELINPVADTVATATFQGAEVDWYACCWHGKQAGYKNDNCGSSHIRYLWYYCRNYTWIAAPLSDLYEDCYYSFWWLMEYSFYHYCYGVYTGYFFMYYINSYPGKAHTQYGNY